MSPRDRETLRLFGTRRVRAVPSRLRPLSAVRCPLSAATQVPVPAGRDLTERPRLLKVTDTNEFMLSFTLKLHEEARR